LFTAFCFDKKETAVNEKEQLHYSHLTEILTPVVKAYSSEKGFDVCVEAMQIFGGYGYTKEYPVEQMVRDCKIASIYEGSNGIQAMDFLGRKIAGSKGAQLQALVKEVTAVIESAKAQQSLAPLAESLEKTLSLFEEVGGKTVEALFSPQAESAFACAHPLLEAAGDVIMAWMLLWRASIAVQKLSGKDAGFYQSKILTARFFIQTLLPATIGKLNAITYENHPVAAMDENLF
jgi:hypothetical protein